MTNTPRAQEGALPCDAPGVRGAGNCAIVPAIVPRTFRMGYGRMTCEVELANPEYRQTSNALAAVALQAFPDLASHACVNGEGPRFGDVMAHTSVAHLLEHIVISVQTRASSEASARFVGATEWIDEEAGIAQVQVSFADDLQALRAFAEATRFLNNAVLMCAP